MVGDRRDDLEAWLEPFVAALRHKAGGWMCPSYVAGLIWPGDRKSVQPMAARSGEPAFLCPNIGDVASPLLVRCRGGKIAVQPVGRPW